jgi:hypothetical protein
LLPDGFKLLAIKFQFGDGHYRDYSERAADFSAAGSPAFPASRS